MTSSRVVRGSKGRILLGVFVIVAITVIIACFNNILSQLAEARKNYEQCHQQQENLSTQLQVIFDYKQRLEKSLKTEKAEHQQSKKDLESKLEEDQTNHEKSINELNLKFSSLQQHYNLLQAEYDDFKEESSKIQRTQLSEANDLQSKLKEVEGQFKQLINEKDKTLEHLKSRYSQVQVEKENLEKQIKGSEDGNIQSENDINRLTKTNFDLQRKLDEFKQRLYGIHKSVSDKPIPGESADNHHIEDANGDNKPNDAEQNNNNPEALDQLHAPKSENEENFNNNNNVLPLPNNAQPQVLPQKSSTPSSSVVSKASLDVVPPLHIPSVTSSSLKPPPNNQLAHPDAQHSPYNLKLPVGVPPVLETHLETGNESKQPKAEDEKDVREDVNNAFPNRYRSNLIASEMAKEDKMIEADKREQIKSRKIEKQSHLKLEAADKENNALEVFDPPINNIDGFGVDESHVEIKRAQHKQIPGIQVEGVKLHGGQAHNKAYDVQDTGDYDKEVPNDMQLEEEAEDDDPDYADHIARQKDPAVRN